MSALAQMPRGPFVSSSAAGLRAEIYYRTFYRLERAGLPQQHRLQKTVGDKAQLLELGSIPPTPGWRQSINCDFLSVMKKKRKKQDEGES